MSLTSCILTYIARSAYPQRPECTVLKALEISNLLQVSEGRKEVAASTAYRPRFRSSPLGRRAVVRVGLVGWECCEVRLCDPRAR